MLFCHMLQAAEHLTFCCELMLSSANVTGVMSLSHDMSGRTRLLFRPTMTEAAASILRRTYWCLQAVCGMMAVRQLDGSSCSHETVVVLAAHLAFDILVAEAR